MSRPAHSPETQVLRCRKVYEVNDIGENTEGNIDDATLEGNFQHKKTMPITFPKVGSFIMQSNKHLFSIYFVPGAILDFEIKINERKSLSSNCLECWVGDRQFY